MGLVAWMMSETAQSSERPAPAPEQSEQRLLIVSPVRNEVDYIELVAHALGNQNRRPEKWIVVDDGSDDETPQLLAGLAEELDFLEVMRMPPRPPDAKGSKDRLAVAAEARAFNAGLNSVDWRSFTHIAKLDGDIELPPAYFQRLLAEFEKDPELGLAGGALRESDGQQGREDAASDYHVRGALKCYSRECLEAIGGIEERLAWDTTDELYARMRGFRTRTLPELVALHQRTCGSADGLMRGAARHGRCAYITHFSLPWIMLRSVKIAFQRPLLVTGVAFLWGYLWAGIVRTPRIEDPDFRKFVHGELAFRAKQGLLKRGQLSRFVPDVA